MKAALTIMGLFIYLLGFSQENYQSGYVITNKHDTISGLVDYRNWDINPESIKFKPKNEANILIYLPTDIIEFGLQNNIYVSKDVSTEISPYQTNALNRDPEFKLQKKRIFLQRLISGKKSLYFYKSIEGKENFYIQNETDFELLLYKKYLKIQGEMYGVAEKKIFVGQLITYLNDCSTIHSSLKEISYKSESLIKLFQHYYNCSESNMTFEKEIEKVKLEIGILTGVSSTTLNLSGSFHTYLVEAGYTPSIRPLVGVNFEVILPTSQKKWSFYNEVLITSWKVNGSYLDYKSDDNYSNNSTEIGYLQMNINNLIRYTYPIGHNYLFLNGGVSNAFSLKETNYNRLESKFFSTEKVEEIKALKDTKKHEIGFCIGTGFKHNIFTLEGRYKYGTGMSDYPTLSSVTNTYYLMFGYSF